MGANEEALKKCMAAAIKCQKETASMDVSHFPPESAIILSDTVERYECLKLTISKRLSDG